MSDMKRISVLNLELSDLRNEIKRYRAGMLTGYLSVMGAIFLAVVGGVMQEFDFLETGGLVLTILSCITGAIALVYTMLWFYNHNWRGEKNGYDFETMATKLERKMRELAIAELEE